MTISLIFNACLIAIICAALVGLTAIVIGLILYFVANAIASLLRTYKEVQIKNRVANTLNYLNKLGEAIKEASKESSKQQDTK